MFQTVSPNLRDEKTKKERAQTYMKMGMEKTIYLEKYCHAFVWANSWDIYLVTVDPTQKRLKWEKGEGIT